MTTYADVLSKTQRIIELVKLFGYSGEVNIKYDVPDAGNDKFELTFIVKALSGQSVPHEMEGLLEAILTSELGYVVSVKDHDYISSLDQDDTSIKSALITDELAIKKVIYRVNNELYDEETITVDKSELDKIDFADFVLEDINEMHEYDRSLYEALLKRAKQHLESASSRAAREAFVLDESHSDSSSGESPHRSARSSSDTYDELRSKKRTKEASAPASQEKKGKPEEEQDAGKAATSIKGKSPGKNS